jgi:PKD repeat protein
MKNITTTLSGLLFLISIYSKGQIPTATITATPNPVCACSAVFFTNTTTNGPTSWAWYFPGGSPSIFITTTSPGNPGIISYCTPGIYTASLVVRNGAGMDSVTQTITVDSLPNLKVYPPSGSICDTAGGSAFDTIYFMATGAATYHWAPATGLSCTNCPNPRAYPYLTTVYTITGTSAAGCVSTITDTVIAGSVLASIWGTDTICPGQPDTLLASGGASNRSANTTYRWNNGNTTAEIVVTPSVTTTYTVTLTSGSGGCPPSQAVFTVTTACVTGIENINNQSGIEIMPNPASSQLSVVLTNPVEKGTVLTITDITGREVYSQPMNSSMKRGDIDISSLAKGLYFIELKTLTSVSVKKFVKD